MSELTDKERWIALLVCLVFFIGIGFYFITQAQECGAKGGRYLVGGKYDYPACVKEIK